MTSMTWLDEEMSGMGPVDGTILAVVAACRYGADWRK